MCPVSQYCLSNREAFVQRININQEENLYDQGVMLAARQAETFVVAFEVGQFCKGRVQVSTNAVALSLFKFWRKIYV